MWTIQWWEFVFTECYGNLMLFYIRFRFLLSFWFQWYLSFSFSQCVIEDEGCEWKKIGPLWKLLSRKPQSVNSVVNIMFSVEWLLLWVDYSLVFILSPQQRLNIFNKHALLFLTSTNICQIPAIALVNIFIDLLNAFHKNSTIIIDSKIE